MISFSSLFAQSRYIETFESVTPGTLPAGWRVVNKSGFHIPFQSNWTVRDSGQSISYLSPFTKTRSHSGKRAISITRYAGLDSAGNQYHKADAWLFTPYLSTLANDSVRFFAAGGYNVFIDSLQIWISTTDTAVSSFNKKIRTINWVPPGNQYGQFQRYTFSLNPYTPGTLIIGFRYFMDCTTGDGYFVQFDDFAIGTTVDVNENPLSIPKKYILSQNFPNPFNPETTIRFDLPQRSDYDLKVFDILGKIIYSESVQSQAAGSYKIKLDLSGYSTGIYFYTLNAGYFHDRKKMILIK